MDQVRPAAATTAWKTLCYGLSYHFLQWIRCSLTPFDAAGLLHCAFRDLHIALVDRNTWHKNA